jgi:hypothetical protein
VGCFFKECGVRCEKVWCGVVWCLVAGKGFGVARREGRWGGEEHVILNGEEIGI